jgi:Glycosyl hydrolase family 76
MAAAALAVGLLLRGAAVPAAGPAPHSFRELGDDAAATLTNAFYTGDGRWRTCLDPGCGAGNADWGSDSLTGVLYERWLVTHDASLVPTFRELQRTEPRYGACRAPRCTGWSDVPMWDAVAALRTYDVTYDEVALRNAEAAYAFVAGSDVFARGACPEIDYQRPHAESGGLKTLETDANATLAAAMLAERTHRTAYLDDARRRYDAVRKWFLDPDVPLYTVYVYDGRTCRALPHRFFASVNGVMIEAGMVLARATGDERYAREARATAHAIRALDDDRGIFTDLQAENDIVQPLVLAMLQLTLGREASGHDGDAFAREWIVRNAAAAAHARRPDGAYGRFFDGPPPAGIVTAWQANGGLALAIAAAALAPDAHAESDDPWARAETKPVHVMPPLGEKFSASLAFTGSGIALIGTLGERCCEAGRARVFVDGRETFDRTGIWQNKSSSGRSLPDSVLFAWRWKTSGPHTIRIESDEPNAKEGGAFIHIRSMRTFAR